MRYVDKFFGLFESVLNVKFKLVNNCLKNRLCYVNKMLLFYFTKTSFNLFALLIRLCKIIFNKIIIGVQKEQNFVKILLNCFLFRIC
jgi:hypothetical protein